MLLAYKGEGEGEPYTAPIRASDLRLYSLIAFGFDGELVEGIEYILSLRGTVSAAARRTLL